MKGKEEVFNQIIRQRLLPLFYHDDADVCLDIVRTLYQAGIRVLEYTNRGADALQNFSKIKAVQIKEMPGLLLGIGTIKSVPEAQAFIRAGADFIVSPIVNSKLASVASKNGLLWIPGCMTPTEIYAAQNAGAELVKLFPGNVLRPDFLIAIKDLFPGLHFMPTGGVEIDKANIGAWFSAGVCAVGIGGGLVSKEILAKRRYRELYTNTIKVMEMVDRMLIPPMVT